MTGRPCDDTTFVTVGAFNTKNHKITKSTKSGLNIGGSPADRDVGLLADVARSAARSAVAVLRRDSQIFSVSLVNLVRFLESAGRRHRVNRRVVVVVVPS
jgi:hypothetical protein